MFKIGEILTCVYVGIFSWDDGREFTKTIPVKCEVKSVEILSSYEGGLDEYKYQLDCSKDIHKRSSKNDGVGLVKTHKLNYKKFLTDGEECYSINLNVGD